MQDEIDEVITAVDIPDNQRLNFLPRYFGKGMMVYEQAVYSLMRRMSADYRGGFWRYRTLSNGGAYMALEIDDKIKMLSENGWSGELSGDAAGIVASMFALSHLAFEFEQHAELFSERYHQLRDYAFGNHPEAPAIIAMCD